MSRVAVHENDNNNDAHHHNPQIQLNNAAAANPHQIIHQPPPPPAAAVGISTTAAPPAGPCPTAAPTTADADNKRFTTSYGMVVWPALPGLSGAATTAINSTASTTTRTIPDLPLPEAAARAMASVQNVHEAAAIPRAMAAAASGPSSHSSEPLVSCEMFTCSIMVVFWAMESSCCMRDALYLICRFNHYMNVHRRAIYVLRCTRYGVSVPY